MDKRVFDIINMKMELNNMEARPIKDTINWYKWALDNGFVQTVYEDSRLMGFIEWIRMKKMPTPRLKEDIDFNVIKTAPILFIMNLCSRNTKVLWQLKRLMEIANKGITYSKWVWHLKRNNRWITSKGGHNV